MELLFFLALLLLLRLIAGTALPSGKAECGALAPGDMPLRVHQTIRRRAQGISIRTVHVEMEGADTVRYTVTGSMPDGASVTLVVDGNEQVLALPDGPASHGLPPAARDRLSQCMPSFHPGPGGARLVKGGNSSWYELDGKLAGGVPVDVKISQDGHDLLMTISDRHS